MEPKIIKVGSTHTNKKVNSKQFIILHHTGPGSFESILKWLSDMPKSADYSRVSCNYLISKIGEIYEIVSPEFDSWHAGKSSAVLHNYHLGKEKYNTVVVENLNDKSIGIELHGDGNETMYPEAQIKACIDLVKYLKNKYKIDPRSILGHEDIAPARKRDPGHYFPWDELFKGIYAG